MSLSRLAPLSFSLLMLGSTCAGAAQTQLQATGSLDATLNTSGNFTATFVYDTDTSLSTISAEASNDVGYIFIGMPYSGSANVGGEQFSFQNATAGLADNYFVSAQQSAETLGYFPEGVHDVFGVVSTNSSEALNGTLDLEIANGIFFGIIIFTGTDYISGAMADTLPAPPALPGAESAFFAFGEFVNGNVVKAGFGDIDSLTVTTVPLPGAILLFPGSLVLLAARAKRARAHR
jgi:hypothetical protein